MIILKTLADKQAKDKEEERLAYTRQNIGETLMLLNQPADAAGYFRDALDYWNSRGRERMVNEGLISQLLSALLKARQYGQAAQFASKLIKEDVGQQQTVGPAFRTEAERLRDANDLKAALELIGEAKKMDPALSPRYFRDLEDIESEVRRRMATDARPATGPQSARNPAAPLALRRAVALAKRADIHMDLGGRITSTFVAIPSANSIAIADCTPGSSG